MKIGNPEGKSPLNPLAGAERSPTAGPGKAERKAADVDASAQVELSNAASNLLTDAGASPEFDTAKVARIAQAIAEGKYQVNAEVIADKLIANAQELLGKPSH